MIFQDDREDRTVVYPILIVGRDTFLSGWGQATGGNSIAAWACKEEDMTAVEHWVRSRSDMENIRVVNDSHGFYMAGDFCNVQHFHIYVVGENHPALQESTPRRLTRAQAIRRRDNPLRQLGYLCHVNKGLRA